MFHAYRSGKQPISAKVWRKLEHAERAAGLSPTLPVTDSPAPLPFASASAASAPLRLSSSSEAELMKVLLRIAAALERLAEKSEE